MNNPSSVPNLPGIPKLITQEMIPNGEIKPRHLAAGTSMAAGDTYYVGSDGIFHKLPAGNQGQLLTMNSSIPSWQTGITLISRTQNINALSLGTTTLYTVPSGKSLVVTKVVPRSTTLTGPNTQATASLGANATSYNDFYAANTFLFDAAPEAFTISPTNYVYPVYAAGKVFSLKITVASTSTTELWAIDVFGYLL